MKKLNIKLAFLVMVTIAFSCFAGCKNDESKGNAETSTKSEVEDQQFDINIAALKGPTGIGMVKLMQDNEDKLAKNNYKFKIEATADAFTADLLKGDVQIAAIPCNAAATLYNKSNGKIKIAAINTLGVLYLMDTGNSLNSVSDLKGKTIYSTGMGTTPEYTLRHLIKAAGLDPQKDVKIEFKSEASEVAAIMAKNQEEVIAMLPQPFVTTVQMNNNKARVALDVTKEWEKLEGSDNTVVTGVIVVNTEYYENNKEAVESFLKEYEKSVDFANASVEEAAKLVEKFGIFNAEVAMRAIPKCNITYINGKNMKTKVNNYLKVLYDENPTAIGGKMPGEDFYVE